MGKYSGSKKTVVYLHIQHTSFDPCLRIQHTSTSHAQANPDHDHLEGVSSDEELDGCKADLDEQKHVESEDKRMTPDAPKDGENIENIDDGPKEPRVDIIGTCIIFIS